MTGAPKDPGPRAPARPVPHGTGTTARDLTPVPAGAEAVARDLPLPAWAGLVALGGALGTLARAGLGAAWPTVAGAVPWTTLVVNLVGSFLLGLLLQCLALTGPDTGWRKAVRLGVGTGVMGGFTTYSTFMLESERLLTGHHALTGTAYLLGSVAAGLAAAAAGLTLAQVLVGGRRRAGVAR